MKADPTGVLTGSHYIDGDFACCEGALAAGCRAAEFAKAAHKDGALTLDHVRAYHKALKQGRISVDGQVAPMLLPDYSNPEVRKKQLTTKYHGTLR